MIYHRDVWMPKEIKERMPVGVLKLKYSRHAQQAAMNDRYGVVALPSEVHSDNLELIEFDTLEDKFVVRHKLCEQKDLVLAVLNDKQLFVKTVWINLRSDKHSTLQRHKYIQRPKK